jgi:hypothetical protein
MKNLENLGWRRGQIKAAIEVLSAPNPFRSIYIPETGPDMLMRVPRCLSTKDVIKLRLLADRMAQRKRRGRPQAPHTQEILFLIEANFGKPWPLIARKINRALLGLDHKGDYYRNLWNYHRGSGDEKSDGNFHRGK